MLATSPVKGMVALTLVLSGALPQAGGAQSGLSGPDATRAVIAEEFLKARPKTAPAAPAKRPVYRRTTPPSSASDHPGVAGAAAVGVTVWRLRPSRRSQDQARLLVHEGPNTAEWTPERIEANTPIALGDRLRLSIESPRSGFLYVVNSERYAGGSTGDPYVIFPTRRTRGGDNQVLGGRLIEVPAQDNQPPFFTAQRSRPDQIGELLTIFVSPTPLDDLAIDMEPVRVDKARLARWEEGAVILTERYELIGGTGRGWTREEQVAGADTRRLLSVDEPAPQTIYRAPSATAGLVLAKVPLQYGTTKPARNPRD